MVLNRIKDISIKGRLEGNKARFIYRFVIMQGTNQNRIEIDYRLPLPSCAVPQKYDFYYDKYVHSCDLCVGGANWLAYDDAVCEGLFTVQLSYSRLDGTRLNLSNLPCDADLEFKIEFLMDVIQPNPKYLNFVIPAVTGNTELARMVYSFEFAITNPHKITTIFTDSQNDSVTRDDSGTWFVASKFHRLNNHLRIHVNFETTEVTTSGDQKIPQNVVIFLECLRADDQGTMSCIFREIIRFVTSLSNRNVTVLKYGDLCETYRSNGNVPFSEFIFTRSPWLRRQQTFENCFSQYYNSDQKSGDELIIISGSQITRDMESLASKNVVFVNKLYRGDIQMEAENYSMGYCEEFSTLGIMKAIESQRLSFVNELYHEPIMIKLNENLVCPNQESEMEWISHDNRIVVSPSTRYSLAFTETLFLK